MIWVGACEKFQRYTQPFTKEAQMQTIVEAVADLHGAVHLRDLTRLISGAPSKLLA
jgi:hypothetical protein